jgi:hypothetical protein
MQNGFIARVGRRGFLRLGALATVAGAFGCEGSAEPTKVETPPAKGGNRSRLAERKPADKTPKSTTVDKTPKSETADK